MKEQHPIDELFARGLGDAEAAPPAAVWEGIVHERNWAHVTLLRLRRQWGWLALVLLLGGAATLLGVNGGSETKLAVAQQGDQLAISTLVAQDVSRTASSSTVASASFTEADVENTRASHVITTNDNSQPSNSYAWRSEPAIAGQPVSFVSETGDPAGMEENRMETATPVTALGVSNKVHQARPERVEVAVTEEVVSRPTNLRLKAELPVPSNAPARGSVYNEVGTTTELEQIRPGMLLVRSSILEHELLAADPLYGTPPEFRGPRRALWIAATAGQYRETRTWHGADVELVNALQSTETPHHTFNVGVLAGMNYKGGWGLATGLEYSAASYDFQHLDQFSSTRDSLVTHVITFNSQVVDSYVDTLTTYTEVRRSVAAVNHYTSLRVPLEGSLHKAWRRWHFGVRGCLALEINTMRSGVTLMNEQGGTRSVDISATEKRTAMLLSGGLAADVGYAINERLAFWASPGYATGLFSLSPTDGTPYAVPERMGIRFRLAYTLRSSQ